jgi:hypothetical protein
MGLDAYGVTWLLHRGQLLTRTLFIERRHHTRLSGEQQRVGRRHGELDRLGAAGRRRAQ